MRRLERMEEEIQKGRKDLRQRKMQAQAVAAQTETDITAKCKHSHVTTLHFNYSH
jgi:hypothetical protein